MGLAIIILAAGHGIRMRSSTPKVLQELAGQPLISRTLQLALSLNPQQLFVVYQHETVKARFSLPMVSWVHQANPCGTGAAVKLVLPLLNVENVLILAADMQLISKESLDALMTQTTNCAILTAKVSDPTGLGRIVRDPEGQVQKIVEDLDCNPQEKNIHEINTSVMFAKKDFLTKWIPQLQTQNKQSELYLPDVINLSGEKIATITIPANEAHGINTQSQLAKVERILQQQQAENLMQAGVCLKDPQRFDLRGKLEHGKDAIIDVNVILEGHCVIGNNVKIDANCYLKNVKIGDNTHIKANSILEDCEIGSDCRVGPFARLRPQTNLADQVHIGNFVEIKKSNLASGSKANHLSYIGDAEIGAKVNIGAGTIFCNYDGINKNKTKVGDGVFIGSNVSLVAPVAIEKNATIGAGSTITKQVPAQTLCIARSKQVTVPGWERPQSSVSDTEHLERD